MRRSAPNKILKAAILLAPTLILAASPATASTPRCDEPPAPCERVQADALVQMTQRRVIEAKERLAELQLASVELPEAVWVQVERIDVSEHVAPLLEASLSRRVIEMEKVKKAGERFAWTFKERFAEMESDTAHPLNPAIHAFVSIAKVPARGVGPLQQALSGVAKAFSHVLQALLA